MTILSANKERVGLHNDITTTGLSLRDDTNAYQETWQLAMNDLLTSHSRDFDYLALLSYLSPIETNQSN